MIGAALWLLTFVVAGIIAELCRQIREEEMLSNYPPGSMVGSGIYSYDFVSAERCDYCGEVQDAEINVNDFGQAEWFCDGCGGLHSFYMEERESDAQEDYAYEDYRDSAYV